MDQASPPRTGTLIHAPNRHRIAFRDLAMILTVLVALGIIFIRLWFLQVVKASELTERASALNANLTPKLAPRGLIKDSKGQLLAGVRSELVVTVIPSELNKNPEALDRLAAILGVQAQ